MMTQQTKFSNEGFSLIEVIMAIGIFMVTVLALVGLLGPTLKSVDEIEKTDEVASVVNAINAFLQNSPDIAKNDSDGITPRFEAIYNAIQLDGDYATLFVYRWYDDGNNEEFIIRLEVGFNGNQDGQVGDDSVVNTVEYGDIDSVAAFSKAAGAIYRVVLTPSSVIPLSYHHDTETNADGKEIPLRDPATNAYRLDGTYSDVEAYNEGAFAMEVRIYAEDPGPTFIYSKGLDVLKNEEPVFTYNTAIVR
jgi:type II secretory pathway pseudopilin PulG